MNPFCWMSGVDDEKYISHINIPGTHDSATQYMKVLLPQLFVCQSSSVYEQLCVGARFIDIRLRYQNDTFYLVHGIGKCKKNKNELLTFDDVFEDFLRFITDNPTEAVLVSVKMDFGKNKAEFFDRFYKSFIKDNKDKWYLENEIPTLSQVRGRLVLIRRCVKGDCTEEKCGIDFSSWEDQGNSRADLPLRTSFGNEKGESALIQDRYKHKKQAKWKNCIIPFFENASPDKKQLCINFLSTAGFPKRNADYINDMFMKYSLKNKKYGIIIADFISEDIAKKIINTNEGVNI